MSVLLFCNYSKCKRIASCFLPGMLDAFRFPAMGTSTANRPIQPNQTNQKEGKMRRFFAVVAILSLLAMIGCAGDDGATGPAGTSAVDKGTISGTVKDVVGVGIAGVSVNTVPATSTATTAADGSFSLANVPIGAYTVTASGAGYTPGSVAGVSVAAGATSSVSIALSSQPPAAASVPGKVVAITGFSPGPVLPRRDRPDRVRGGWNEGIDLPLRRRQRRPGYRAFGTPVGYGLLDRPPHLLPLP